MICRTKARQNSIPPTGRNISGKYIGIRNKEDEDEEEEEVTPNSNVFIKCTASSIILILSSSLVLTKERVKQKK